MPAESIHAPGTSTGGLGQNDHIVAVVTTGGTPVLEHNPHRQKVASRELDESIKQ